MQTNKQAKASFSGHETFPFRYPWLPKAIGLVETDPRGFGSEDAIVRLGVGKNMVLAIKHWAVACGLIEEDPEVKNNRGRYLRATELGKHLLGADGWDTYLEDPATLWLLHWQIARTPQHAATWYWFFNHFTSSEFTKADVLRLLAAFAAEAGWPVPSPVSLRRDIDCLVRTYAPARPSRTLPLEDTLDSPLTTLGLVREFGDRAHYLLLRGTQESLPDEVFAFALSQFIETRGFSLGPPPLRSITTLSFDIAAFSPGSPGRVFCLTQDALLARLERLESLTNGAFTFTETAGLKQIMVKKAFDPTRLLRTWYRGARPKNARSMR